MATTTKTKKTTAKKTAKTTAAKTAETKTAAKKTAAKKTTAAAAAKKTTTTKKPAVKVVKKEVKETAEKTSKAICIDYPVNNETVYCGHYCFRLGGTANNIEWMRVSINGGSWQDCRHANGYWWFDWWNFETGAFYAEALALVDGKEVKTAKRKFTVTL